MANEKRQRQDQNRQQKVVQQQVQVKKTETANKRKKIFTVVGGALALILAIWGLSQCGNGDSADTTIASDATEASATTDAGPSTSAPTNTASPKLSSKPTVNVPSAKPTKLEITDLEVGTGPVIEKGDSVRVQYVGVGFSDKKQFDASWDRNSTFTVENVGEAPVIKGWNDGLLGMKQGGRRQLVIPPDLGYGAAGSGPIGPNETLVFVIDAVEVIKK